MKPTAVATPLMKPKDPPAAVGMIRLATGTVVVEGRTTEFTLDAVKPGPFRRRGLRACRKCGRQFMMQSVGQQYCRDPCRAPTEKVRRDKRYRRMVDGRGTAL